MRPSPVALVIALPLALVLSVLQPAHADDDPAEAACHSKDTTLAIMQCLGDLARQWDKRLNTAYGKAIAASDSPARKQALTKAERAWVAYRDANCGWYDIQEGSIRLIEGANCMLAMTRNRTLELQNGAP